MATKQTKDLGIDDVINTEIKRAATQTSYFYKVDVVNRVLRNRAAVVEVEKAAKAGLQTVLKSYVATKVTRGLHSRDGNGLRVFEAYAKVKGEAGYRYQTFRSMSAAAIAATHATRKRLATQVNNKVDDLAITAKVMNETGAKTVNQAYDQIVVAIHTARGKRAA